MLGTEDRILFISLKFEKKKKKVFKPGQIWKALVGNHRGCDAVSH